MINMLKTLTNGILESMKSYRGNWNENDPSSPSYIKNRTHYVTEEVIFSVDNVEFEDMEGVSVAQIYKKLTLEKKNKYTVLWDNKKFTCECKELDGILFLGNKDVAAGKYDGNIPFIIGATNDGITCMTTEMGMTHSFKIIGEKVVKIPSKFLDLPKQDYVSFAYNQKLTEEQKQTARNNIGVEDGMKDTIETLTNDIIDLEYAVDEVNARIDKIETASYITLRDTATGYDYIVSLHNGQFVHNLKIINLQIVSNPNKMDYSDTDIFDPTGMVIMATYGDGSSKEITDYEYPEFVELDKDYVEIKYTENGITYSVILKGIVTRSLEPALIDFYYNTDADGNYLITGWKGTYNGEPSTRCIIPSSNRIIV